MRQERKKVISKQVPSANSITCGTDNPASIGCEFYELEGGEVATFFTTTIVHEGQLNIMHGGLTAAVLDELMGRAVMAYYRNTYETSPSDDMVSRCVTAEMTTKYKKPISIGQKIYGYGRVLKREGRRTYASSELLNEDNEVVALAEAVFVEVKISKAKLTDEISSDKNHQKLSKNDPKEL